MTVEVEAAAGPRLDRFGKSHQLPALTATGSRQTWSVDLEPFELLAGRFSAADVTLQNPQVSFAQDVENDLYLRIRDLGERVAQLQQPTAMKLLTNSGFEQPPDADDPLPGWQIVSKPARPLSSKPNRKRWRTKPAICQHAGGCIADYRPGRPLGSGHLSVLVWLVSPIRPPAPFETGDQRPLEGTRLLSLRAVGQGTGQAIGGMDAISIRGSRLA